jgi:hypothetical protein
VTSSEFTPPSTPSDLSISMTHFFSSANFGEYPFPSQA